MFPHELPSFGSSPDDGKPRSTAGRCATCGKDQIARFEDWSGALIGTCCVIDALDDAEAVHLSANLHQVTGCPKDPCVICRTARG